MFKIATRNRDFSSSLCRLSFVLLFLQQKAHREFILIHYLNDIIIVSTFSEGISVRSVTHTHLVAYDLDRDLLPLIQAHCNHRFDEEVASAAFNLGSLERAIEETFIRGRPRIEGSSSKLIFREGSRSLRVFQEIREKVKQVNVMIFYIFASIQSPIL